MNERVLVVSAHTADWIWRCSGAVLNYLKNGAEVSVVCLTHGARGESTELWKREGMTVEEVKRIRREEVEAVAKKIGVQDLEVWDYDDCILQVTPEILQQLNVKIRKVRPTVIITHDKVDNWNVDHGIGFEIVAKALLMARQRGIESEGLLPVKSAQIYGMEPGFAEHSDFLPTVYMDITDVYEEKVAAMECVTTQPATPSRHTHAAFIRGKQAKVMPGGGANVKYAECFSVAYPFVVSGKLV